MRRLWLLLVAFLAPHELAVEFNEAYDVLDDVS